MELRLATPDDVAELAELSREAFCVAFAHLYDPADLDAFLSEHKTVAAFAPIVDDPGRRVMLAVDGETIAGYCIIALDSDYAEHSDAVRPLALEQLYIAPGRIGGGIGARLMDWVLAQARERGADAVQLSVWSENHGAQRFYRRHGFDKIADIEFWVGTQCDHEFLFELRLQQARLAGG